MLLNPNKLVIFQTLLEVYQQVCDTFGEKLYNSVKSLESCGLGLLTAGNRCAVWIFGLTLETGRMFLPLPSESGPFLFTTARHWPCAYRDKALAAFVVSHCLMTPGGRSLTSCLDYSKKCCISKTCVLIILTVKANRPDCDWLIVHPVNHWIELNDSPPATPWPPQKQTGPFSFIEPCVVSVFAGALDVTRPKGQFWRVRKVLHLPDWWERMRNRSGFPPPGPGPPAQRWNKRFH